MHRPALWQKLGRELKFRVVYEMKGDFVMYENAGFDMKEYIRKRMLEIEQLEDRTLFKKVAGDLLVEVHEYNKSLYNELEDKILNESSAVQNRYAIYVSMTDRQHFDATDSFLQPMLTRDTVKQEIDFQEVAKALKEKREIKLYPVFCKARAAQIHQLLQEQRTFDGVIKTQKQEYKATFTVKKNEEYLNLIQELYDIFGANHQSWQAVCGAYPQKMLDVWLSSSEPMKGSENVIAIQVDFAEYADQMYTDTIPLWNLSQITEKTSTYTSPCVDKINYEHKIFGHRLKRGCEYLVHNTKVEITNIRRVHGDLYITCPIEAICEWDLYQVNKRKGGESYPYPILSNQYKESFSGAITEMFRKSIKTKGELARLIEAFQYDDYLAFCDIKIADKIPPECNGSNYNMDGFLQDEIRRGNHRQALVIDFAAVDPGNYLNEDIMSFLVTQVQKIFAEYHCVGRLIY